MRAAEDGDELAGGRRQSTLERAGLVAGAVDVAGSGVRSFFDTDHAKNAMLAPEANRRVETAMYPGAVGIRATSRATWLPDLAVRRLTPGLQ